MELLTQNSKLKKTSAHFGVRVFNFGIPAYKTKSGKVTCPFADKCVKYCYAQKGAYIWGNVSPAFEARYVATKQDDFQEKMISEVKKKRADFVRIHDSGDFYSKSYRDKWFEIMSALPNTKFYAYTNSLDLFRGFELPNNFDVIFSDGGKLADTINKDVERHSKVFPNLEQMIAEGYTDTSDYDLYATKWFNPTNKVGLIFH